MQFFRQKKYQQGFSTLEMLLAMFVLLLALTAVISVSFGNQSMITGSQTNAEALNIAQGLLEKAQADARKDFNLVNPIAEAENSDGFKYYTNVVQKDYFTKLVTAFVDFPEDSGRRGKTELSAIVANFNGAVGGDTCSSVLLPDAENWKNIDSSNIRDIFTPDDFNDLAGINVIYSITDIDVYKGKIYVTVDPSLADPLDDPAAADAAPTFFTFDISDAGGIDAIHNGFIDNNNMDATGLNAVVVADDPAAQGLYAYVAAGSGDQLQVIDVGAVPPVKVSSLGVDGGAGNSIFYKNGYIYLGLKGSGGSGDDEFHIIDVHDPANPSAVGNLNIGNNDINAIYVRGRYAYLATTNSKNLIVADISNAADPGLEGYFDDGGSNHGKSVFMLGDVLYLGRTTIGGGGAGTELSVVDESEPTAAINESIVDNEAVNKSVDAVIVRGNDGAAAGLQRTGLAFLLTKSDFRVFDAAAITASSTAEAVINLPNVGDCDYEAVMDCEGNTFYVGSNDDEEKGYLSVIGI